MLFIQKAFLSKKDCSGDILASYRACAFGVYIVHSLGPSWVNAVLEDKLCSEMRFELFCVFPARWCELPPCFLKYPAGAISFSSRP